MKKFAIKAMLTLGAIDAVVLTFVLVISLYAELNGADHYGAFFAGLRMLGVMQ